VGARRAWPPGIPPCGMWLWASLVSAQLAENWAAESSDHPHSEERFLKLFCTLSHHFCHFTRKGCR
jgi:hypothetical protein